MVLRPLQSPKAPRATPLVKLSMSEPFQSLVLYANQGLLQNLHSLSQPKQSQATLNNLHVSVSVTPFNRFQPVFYHVVTLCNLDLNLN